MNKSEKDKKYKCPQENCNASYTKKCRLEVHMRYHTGAKPFKCDIEDCSKSYTNLAHLRRHKCLSHEKTCEISCSEDGCGRVFNNKYSLKKHLNQCHGANNIFKCAYCPEEFKQKRQLKKHSYEHTGKAALRSVFNKWTEFCKHRRQSCKIKIDHKCVICEKVFKTKVNLKSHSKVHLNESQIETYSCTYAACKRSYKYKKNLDYHIAVYHKRKNDGIAINCTVKGCSGVFKSKKNLRQHLANIHSEVLKKEKPRRPRKDKGKRKTCMASILSGVPLPLKEHLHMINKDKEFSKFKSEIDIVDEFNKHIKENIKDDIEDECNKNIKESIKDDIENEFNKDIKDSIKDDIEDEFNKDIKENIKDDIEDEFNKDIKESIKDENGSNEALPKYLLSIEKKLKQKFVIILRDFNIPEYCNVDCNIADCNGFSVPERLTHCS